MPPSTYRTVVLRYEGEIPPRQTVELCPLPSKEAGILPSGVCNKPMEGIRLVVHAPAEGLLLHDTRSRLRAAPGEAMMLVVENAGDVAVSFRADVVTRVSE